MKIGPKYAALAVLLLVLGAVPALTGRGEEAAPKEKKRTTPAGVIVNPAEEGLAARCPICGDFLYKHNNPDYPDFRCIPPNADKRGIPETRRMVCPVCFAVNKVKFVRRLDFSRGIDSDLCYHSGKPSDYMTNIYTCPYCGYTAFADGFYELPPGKAAADEELKRVMDRYFEFPPSFVEWVKKTLTKPLHDRLDALVKKVYKEGDWTLVKDQESIPRDLKIDYLIRCQTRLGAGKTLLAGLYMRVYYIYRQAFVKAEVIEPLRRAYILNTILLYKPEAFENEEKLLEDLASLATDKIYDTLGVKVADYTPKEVIDKTIETIKRVNGVLDGTADKEYMSKVRRAGVTDDDLQAVRFTLFLELASNYLRIGDLSATVYFLSRAEALARSGKMFASMPEDKRGKAVEECLAIVRRKNALLSNHQRYMAKCLEYLKYTILHGTIRMMYYPMQAYLVGNLYYRLEADEYKPAKIWLKMAKRAAVIYDYLGLPPEARNGFTDLVDSMLETDVIKAAADYTQADLVDVDELFALTKKIREIESSREKLKAGSSECREFLEFLGKVLLRYQAVSGDFPDSLETLLKMELISERTANGFRCPVTGKKYGYTPPSLLKPYTIAPLVYDEYPHDDATGILGYILFTDGTIKEILSGRRTPTIGPEPR